MAQKTIRVMTPDGPVDYIDMWAYRDERYPFQIFIGGRDGGKTFSYLQGLVNEYRKTGSQFIFMRRQQSEMDELVDDKNGVEKGNPFKKVNAANSWNYGMRMISGKTGGIYHREYDEEKERMKYVGAPIGYCCSMKSVTGIKGIDWTNCNDWFYDEFIPEEHVNKMRGEGRALLSAYDTICRNRELEGYPPIRLTLASNATDIYNPICKYLGIVADLENLQRTGKQDKYYPDRRLAVHLLETPENLKKARENTALAALARGTDYYDMAFNNKFAYNDFALVEYRVLKGWDCYANLDFAYIYRKKGEELYHVSYREANHKIRKYSAKRDFEEMEFRRRVGIWLQDIYIEGRLTFESYELKAFILEHIF